MINLIPVDETNIGHLDVLYNLLLERTPEQSISHKSMPSFHQHIEFVESEPYKAWYIIDDDGMFVGTTYLTKQNEIGITISTGFQGKGYGKKAVKTLMSLYDGPFLANINPENVPSRLFFESLGFEFIQVTYKHG